MRKTWALVMAAAMAGFFQLIEDGYFDGEENLLFVHTGGAGALFAVDMLPE